LNVRSCAVSTVTVQDGHFSAS